MSLSCSNRQSLNVMSFSAHMILGFFLATDFCKVDWTRCAAHSRLWISGTVRKYFLRSDFNPTLHSLFVCCLVTDACPSWCECLYLPRHSLIPVLRPRGISIQLPGSSRVMRNLHLEDGFSENLLVHARYQVYELCHRYSSPFTKCLSSLLFLSSFRPRKLCRFGMWSYGGESACTLFISVKAAPVLKCS